MVLIVPAMRTLEIIKIEIETLVHARIREGKKIKFYSQIPTMHVLFIKPILELLWNAVLLALGPMRFRKRMRD
jgi:hypothetical protein